MGITTQSRGGMTDVLFSPVQQQVLGLLLGQPDRRFQSAELIRMIGGGTGAVHRQLVGLTEAGILTVTPIGNQKHYQANRASPIFNELHGIVVKTVGLAEPLRHALEPLSRDIDAAFVYGSIAKGTDTAASDIDLMVISGRIGYSDLYTALHPVEQMLARKISPNIVTPDEWRIKRDLGQSFVSRVDEGPKLFLIGDGDALT